MQLVLEDIHKHFGPVRANDGITLSFQPGRIYGILGENGAGKSTLMKVLSGFQAPTRGSIRIDGEVASFSSPSDALKRGVGMLYQEPKDFPPLQVIENHLLAHDDHLLLDLKEGESVLRSYARRYGFEIDPHVEVSSLTLGARQQMELMRLLALGAELLILDEPTTGISAEQKEKLFGTMRRLSAEEGQIIILVSHKLEEVQELCDEVAILRKGKLVGTQQLPSPTRDLVRMMFGEDVPRSERQPADLGSSTLRLENVSIHTHRLDVSEVSLEAHEGEVIGLAGLEGSGQRMLLQACAGLIPTQDGTLNFDGEPIRGKRSPFFWTPWLAGLIFVVRTVWLAVDLARGQVSGIQMSGGTAVAALSAGAIWLIGSILISWTREQPYHAFQRRGGAYVPAGRLEEGLVSGLTIAEHRALSAPNSRFMLDWDRARHDMLDRIGIFSIVGKPETPVNELSGGNQQRVLLALLNSPLRLLLLEHPTRGLDVTSANFVWDRFQERCAQGTTVLFMSADLDELLDRSDRIVVFFGGKVLKVLRTSETSVDELGHLIGGQES
jgi:simple sugar transport system ATP-binding protein